MDNPSGFTEELKRLCEDACAENGEAACWMLPDMVEPCEHITPCDKCLEKANG